MFKQTLILLIFFVTIFMNNVFLYAKQDKVEVYCYDSVNLARYGNDYCELKLGLTSNDSAYIDDSGKICFSTDCPIDSRPEHLSFSIDTTQIQKKLSTDFDINILQNNFHLDYKLNKIQEQSNDFNKIYGIEMQHVKGTNYKDLVFMLKLSLKDLKIETNRKKSLKKLIHNSFDLDTKIFAGSRAWADCKLFPQNNWNVSLFSKTKRKYLKYYIQEFYYHYIFKLTDKDGTKRLVLEDIDSNSITVKFMIDDKKLLLKDIFQNDVLTKFSKINENKYTFIVPKDQKNNINNYLYSVIKDIYHDYLYTEYIKETKTAIIKNKKLYITIPSDSKPCNDITGQAPITILGDQFKEVCIEGQETNDKRNILKFTTYQKLKDNNFINNINMNLYQYAMEFESMKPNGNNDFHLKLKQTIPLINIRCNSNTQNNHIFSYNGKESIFDSDKKIHIIPFQVKDCKWPDYKKIVSDKYEITGIDKNKIYTAVTKPKYVTFKLMQNDLLPSNIFTDKDNEGKKTFNRCENIGSNTQLIKCQTELDQSSFVDVSNSNMFANKNYIHYIKIINDKQNKKQIVLDSRQLKIINPEQFTERIQLLNKVFVNDSPAIISLDDYIKISSNDITINKYLKKYGLQKKGDIDHDDTYIYLQTQPVERTIMLSTHSDNSRDIEMFNHQIFSYNSTISSNCEENSKKKCITIQQPGEIKANLFEPQNLYSYELGDNLNVIVTANCSRKQYAIKFFRKELSEDRKKGYILSSTPDLTLDGINTIQTTEGQTEQDKVFLIIPKDTNNVDQFFCKHISPKEQFSYINREGNCINLLIKNPNQRVLVILYPISYTSSYRSFYDVNDEKINIKFILLNGELLNLIVNIKRTQKYKDIFFCASDEYFEKFNRNDASYLMNLPADPSQDFYPWTESLTFHKFKEQTSSAIDILYFSKFRDFTSIKNLFEDLNVSKVYLINFSYNPNLKSEMNKIRIKKIHKNILKRNDFQVKNNVINKNEIFEFFKLN